MGVLFGARSWLNHLDWRQVEHSSDLLARVARIASTPLARDMRR